MLPSIFKPQFNYKLLGIGNRYDGVYLVESNSLSNSECIISFGIATNWDFERDFLNYNKIDIPETIGITFSKIPIKLGSYKDLSHKLDRPNKHNKKEIPLYFND